MTFKIIIITLLVLIMFSLAMGLRYVCVDKKNSTRAVRSLTWRVGLSVTLLVLLAVGLWMGWIQPHGVGEIPTASEGNMSADIRN